MSGKKLWRELSKLCKSPGSFLSLGYEDACDLENWCVDGCLGMGRSLEVWADTHDLPVPLLTREELVAEMPGGDPGTPRIRVSMPSLLMVLRKKLDPAADRAAADWAVVRAFAALLGRVREIARE